MDWILYLLARTVVGLLQALPLRFVARVGRAFGALAYVLDGRHRKVALKNLTMAFGREKSPEEIRAIARENFRRIGENFACAAKTASMTVEQLRPHVEFVAGPPFTGAQSDNTDISTGNPAPRPKLVAAIGHFGNFELYARFGQFAPAPGYKTGTTYRGLRQPSLNRLMQQLRAKSGCQYFERRFDMAALRAFMNQPGVLLGLLADQSSGPRGLRLPFFGRQCSTSPAPALFALRYSCHLHTGICYRVGLAQWRIEAGPEIPTEENGQPRSTLAIMSDVNKVFEAAVRKDPANWFWVHNRWKQFEKELQSTPAPEETVLTANPR